MSLPTIEETLAAPVFNLTDLSLLGLMTLWGMNFVVVKASVAQFLPLGFTALRFGLAALALVIVARASRLSLRVSRADLGRLALLGLVGYVLYQPLFVLGLAYTTAGNSAIILAISPAIVAVVNHVLSRERLSRRAWMGVGLSFGGLALVIVGSPRTLSLAPEFLLGDLMTLGAALCWAAYTVMTRPLVARLPSLTVTTLSLVIGTSALFLIAVPSFLAQDWGLVNLSGWAGLSYSGLLAIGLGYAMWARGVQKLGGTRTAVYVNLPPVVATLAGVWLLGEQITLVQLVGAAGVIGGILLTRLKS